MKTLLNYNRSEKKVPLFTPPEEVYTFHRELPGYTPTPLISLENIASDLGVNKLLIKDEGMRFGLKAFKALGASYAVYRFLYERSGYHLTPDKFFSDEGRNLADGRVEIRAQGPGERMSDLLAAVHAGPPGARVDSIEVCELEKDLNFDTFTIR